MTDEDAEQVAELLRDARIADGGSEEALAVCDVLASKQLLAKARGLRAAANSLDPAHKCPAWKLYP